VYLFVLNARRINLAHPPRQLFQLPLHGMYIVEDREALGKHRTPAQIQSILRQIACADSFAARDVAVVERFDLGQHFEQGGFPRAVGAHQSDPVLRGNQPVQVFEK
jgi:hypothetical protein